MCDQEEVDFSVSEYSRSLNGDTGPKSKDQSIIQSKRQDFWKGLELMS